MLADFPFIPLLLGEPISLALPVQMLLTFFNTSQILEVFIWVLWFFSPFLSSNWSGQGIWRDCIGILSLIMHTWENPTTVLGRACSQTCSVLLKVRSSGAQQLKGIGLSLLLVIPTASLDESLHFAEYDLCFFIWKTDLMLHLSRQFYLDLLNKIMYINSLAWCLNHIKCPIIIHFNHHDYYFIVIIEQVRNI